MSHLKPEEISHLAQLARLTLLEDEKQKFAEQLPNILDFVDQLQKADLATSQDVAGVSQESLRDDEIGSDSLSLAQLEKLAPDWKNDQLVVPPVFGESNE